MAAGYAGERNWREKQALGEDDRALIFCADGCLRAGNTCVFQRALWLQKTSGQGRVSASKAREGLVQGREGRGGEDGQGSVLFVGKPVGL